MGYWQGSTWVPDDRPRARATRAAAQSINSASTTLVQLDTSSFASGITVDTSNYRLTCVTAGVYRVSGTVAFAGGTSGAIIVSIYKNGSLYASAAVTSTFFGTAPVATDLVSLSTGDYVDLRVLQSSGSSQNTSTAVIAMELV